VSSYDKWLKATGDADAAVAAESEDGWDTKQIERAISWTQMVLDHLRGLPEAPKRKQAFGRKQPKASPTAAAVKGGPSAFDGLADKKARAARGY